MRVLQEKGQRRGEHRVTPSGCSLLLDLKMPLRKGLLTHCLFNKTVFQTFCSFKLPPRSHRKAFKQRVLAVSERAGNCDASHRSHHSSSKLARREGECKTGENKQLLGQDHSLLEFNIHYLSYCNQIVQAKYRGVCQFSELGIGFLCKKQNSLFL